MLSLPTPALIGVVHLPALPGSPQHHLPVEEIASRAIEECRILEAAGFDAVIIENFGDAPFSSTSVSPATVAAMAVVAGMAGRECRLKLGINVLRNDVVAALGVASAVGGSFVRVNVHTGVAATDQGLIEGRASETLRFRKLLGVRIAVLADVHVKHATPLSQPDLSQAARETAYRGMADGLIVTGVATGSPAAMEDIRTVRAAVPDRRVFVGSGVTCDTVAACLQLAGGVIVGSALKAGGDPSRPVEPALVTALASAAGRC